jgi:hypothetical protein
MTKLLLISALFFHNSAFCFRTSENSGIASDKNTLQRIIAGNRCHTPDWTATQEKPSI